MNNREVIDAARGVKWSVMTQKDQSAGLEVIVRRIWDLKGVEVMESEIRKEIDELGRKINVAHRDMTIQEIGLALEYGVTEQYGNKDTRMAMANFFSWLEKFKTSEERKEILRGESYSQIQRDRKFQALPEDIDRKNEEFRKRAPMREWNRFKEIGKVDIMFDGYAAAVYDALEGMGKIKVTEETADKASKESERQIRSEKIRELSAFSFGAALDDLTTKIEYRRKKILLEWYFQTLKSRNVELVY